MRERRASDASRLLHALSTSASVSPGGGAYSRRPYVRSFVCTFPKSVATSCFSTTHRRFVVCLYALKSADCCLASVYVPVKSLPAQLVWISESAERS